MPTKAIEAPENNEKPVKVPVGAVRASAENRGEESWYTLFRLIDHDNDGLVPLVELQTAITNSAKMLGLNQEEASMLLVDLGQNNDKLVDFGEFSAMMAKAKKMRLRRVVLFAMRMVMTKDQTQIQLRYLLQYNCFPPPLFMIIISLMQIVAYFYYAYASDDKLSPIGPVPFESLFILDPTDRKEFWRYFTYQFIHIGYYHLIGNVVVQLILGIPLELVHKFWRIGAIYTIGAMTGSLLMTSADPKTYLGGASGGVYTLISAHVANTIINWREMDFNWIRATILAVFIGTDVGVSVYQRIVGDSGDHKVSNMAHLGGFITGLLLGVVLLRNLRLRAWERVIWWICLIAYLTFITVLIVIILRQ